MKVNSYIMVLFLISQTQLWGQQASITEESRSLETYSFHDPNPIPILTNNPKIYPYHKFEGYEHEAKSRSWNVVTLENDYIKVFVLPEVGGKVWGAVDKSTGHEFIYRNEVMKFRNISMRGPWTSGGIEFNFGIIGHHPSTATPVDYIIQQHDDGSVSCTVGNIDLPSRTHWRVKIILPPDKTYFKTQVLWYNPTALTQSYYNWMTAAAFATEDLEFYTPGDQYLKHSGEAKSWPFDEENRNLSHYRANNFGPSKSYHVVGEYNDFFGGYYRDQDVGFGHWSRYDEMPGQKLWLWALSRSGGIWEDLLTDSDGQYIEFQAGRLYDQYAPDSHVNPITQVPFESYAYDNWQELWFPVKEIGGISEVSPHGVLHVREQGDMVEVGLNSFEAQKAQLIISLNGQQLEQHDLNLKPGTVWKSKLKASLSDQLQITVPQMNLAYHSTANPALKRPFQSSINQPDQASAWWLEANELLEYREFEQAKAVLEKLLSAHPNHMQAHLALAELNLRNHALEKAQKHIQTVLGIDTYHAKANYLAGCVYRAQKDETNALESFSWATRAAQFRSPAYTQMAEVLLAQSSWQEAAHYAKKALEYDAHNLRAMQVMALCQKRRGLSDDYQNTITDILNKDPLNHFAHWEQESLEQVLKNEFPQQTLIELALDYYSWGQNQCARKVLSEADHLMSSLWQAYLADDDHGQQLHLDNALSKPAAFQFPFRRESLEVLEWANQKRDHWKFKYALALLYWHKGRPDEALTLMDECQNQPLDESFYLARADLKEKMQSSGLKDLNHALKVNPNQWRIYDALIKHHQSQNNWKEVLALARKGQRKWPKQESLSLQLAEALLYNEDYQGSINVLNKLNLLPFEGASASRTIYERAHLLRALQWIDRGKYQQALDVLAQAQQWPERLGVGKPYDPDQRQIQLLQAYSYRALGQESVAQKILQDLLDYAHEFRSSGAINQLWIALASTTTSESGSVEVDHHENSSLWDQWAYHQSKQQPADEIESQLKNQDWVQFKINKDISTLYQRGQ